MKVVFSFLNCTKMASFRSNQIGGCSKAQASLSKILRTITSVKSPPLPRFDIDLNLSLVDAFWESDVDGESENGNLDACSFVGKQIDSDSSGNSGEKMKEGSGSCSDITTVLHDVAEEESNKEDTETKPLKEQNDKGGGGNGGDCFGLLIAAAELISSTEAESSPSGDKEATTTREKATEERETSNAGESPGRIIREMKSRDTSASALPVVRSKRGRSQVLPYRYRDSVLLLEPPSKRRREPKTK